MSKFIAIICFLLSLWITFTILLTTTEETILQLILAAILFSSSGIIFAIHLIHSIISKQEEKERLAKIKEKEELLAKIQGERADAILRGTYDEGEEERLTKKEEALE